MNGVRLLVVAVVLAATALLVPSLASSGASDDIEARSRVDCLRGTVELRLRIEVDSSGSDLSGSDSSGSGSNDSRSGELATHPSAVDHDDDDDDPEDDTIDVELRVNVPGAPGVWRIVLLHERQLVSQGRWRARPGGYRYRLSRTVPNWPGSESVTARLTAPNGRVCRVSATV